jgi:hypothetical protein
LLLRNEYLAAENRILKAQIKTRLQLSDAERATLAEIGHRLGFAFGGALLDPLALAGSPSIKRLQPLVGETRSKKGCNFSSNELTCHAVGLHLSCRIFAHQPTPDSVWK